MKVRTAGVPDALSVPPSILPTTQGTHREGARKVWSSSFSTAHHPARTTAAQLGSGLPTITWPVERWAPPPRYVLPVLEGWHAIENELCTAQSVGHEQTSQRHAPVKRRLRHKLLAQDFDWAVGTELVLVLVIVVASQAKSGAFPHFLGFKCVIAVLLGCFSLVPFWWPGQVVEKA